MRLLRTGMSSDLNSGQGPAGRVIAVGSLSFAKERGESRPSRRPLLDPTGIVCFTVFAASSIFPLLGLKMGQHGST